LANVFQSKRDGWTGPGKVVFGTLCFLDGHEGRELIVMEDAKMKDSKKHHVLLLAVLAAFTLAGCSSVKSTHGPSVNDSVAKLTGTSHNTEQPSLAVSDRSVGRPSPQSGSVWMSCVVAKEPTPQRVQGQLLVASDTFSGTSAHHLQRTRRVARVPESSDRPGTASVSDALKETLRGVDTTGQSTMRKTVVEVMTATEITDVDNTAEEPSDK
jgi:hypothetical protein